MISGIDLTVRIQKSNSITVYTGEASIGLVNNFEAPLFWLPVKLFRLLLVCSLPANKDFKSIHADVVLADGTPHTA